MPQESMPKYSYADGGRAHMGFPKRSDAILNKTEQQLLLKKIFYKNQKIGDLKFYYCFIYCIKNSVNLEMQ